MARRFPVFVALALAFAWAAPASAVFHARSVDTLTRGLAAAVTAADTAAFEALLYRVEFQATKLRDKHFILDLEFYPVEVPGPTVRAFAHGLITSILTEDLLGYAALQPDPSGAVWYAENRMLPDDRAAFPDEWLGYWGPSVTLHVQELESIDGWPVLSGSNTATVGVPSYFTVSGVSSSMGHELEYQLYDSYNEQVPGTPQGWVAMEDLSMTWGAAGVRVLKVQARCAAHPDVESITSQPFVVTISE